MPEPPSIDQPQAGEDRSLLLRLLHEEQTHLRKEIDDLRQKQQQHGQKEDEEKGGGDKDGKEGDEQPKKNEEPEKKKPPVKERARSWMKAHPLTTIGVLIGTVVLIIASILLWRYLSSYEDTDDAFVDGHTDPISPRISGFVTAIHVENTYSVKKGQLLVELDPRDYQVAQDRAQAQLAQAQAGFRAQLPNVPITQTAQSTQVAMTEAGVVSASANVAAATQRYRSAVADLHQAEANEANAAREEERYRKLVAKEEVSQELYDQRATAQQTDAALVQARRESADAAAKVVDAAEASLAQSQQQAVEARANQPRQVAVQHETLAVRQANVQAAQAALNQAQLNLEYTRIYAPEDGIIGDKQVQLADQVQPGQELFALTQTNDIWVTANFKETEVRQMQPGQSVTIYVDALKQKFDGYVEALPGASGAVYSLLPPENATGNYVKVVQRLPVRIRFKPNQPDANRLAPGMSVEPKVWIK
jgi:membrane fusion protein (multidrug efflux system)